ncbi:unnamed protein product, partial [Iphiclides podalirius]
MASRYRFGIRSGATSPRPKCAAAVCVAPSLGRALSGDQLGRAARGSLSLGAPRPLPPHAPLPRSAPAITMPQGCQPLMPPGSCGESAGPHRLRLA